MDNRNPNLDKFDHVVVLMLENRSFDNLLGFLYGHDQPRQFLGRGEPVFRGVAGRDDLFNPDEQGNPIYVGRAPSETEADMCHPCPDPGEFYQPHVNCQLYGQDEVPGDSSALPDPAPMNGFVRDYIRSLRAQTSWSGEAPTYENYRVIMDCFGPEAVPVLNGLARHFAVSDEWFCSVPSQTFCNRSFFHSAQSRGWVTNADYVKWPSHNHAVTIFERLSAKLGAGRDWRIYWDHDNIHSLTRLIHPSLEDSRFDANFRDFRLFAQDCANGDLPAYTFIEPRLLLNHNDMHPPVFLNQNVHSSVLAGECLVSDVYNAVRTGKHWPRSLLLITFDEHGGCYDHWPPPRATPPDPNPSYELEAGFRFDRCGVRVPAIFVSPYVAPGAVVRSGGPVPFDHTSLIRTLCARWELDGLTARDQAAPDFAAVLSLSEPRLETPALDPRPYTPPPPSVLHEQLLTNLQHALFGLLAHRQGILLPKLEKLGHALGLCQVLGTRC